METNKKDEINETDVTVSNNDEFATIEPNDIVMDDDSDMPLPETKEYEKFIACTDKFMSLFS